MQKAEQHGRKRHRNHNRGKQRHKYHSDSDRAALIKNRVLEHEKNQASTRESKSKIYETLIPKIVDSNIEDELERPVSAQDSNKDSLRARYWSYLFENLQRAVDEIYKTCDNDESIVECQV